MRFETLLAGAHGTPLGRRAASEAVAAANEVGASRVILVEVVTPRILFIPPEVQTGDLIHRLDEGELAAARLRLAELHLPRSQATVTREARLGGAVEELSLSAEEAHADLIVTSTHARGALGRLFFGSVSANLLRTAPCPVLVVGEDRPVRSPMRLVLAAIDLSPISREVLDAAVGLMGGRPGRLIIVSLIEPHDGSSLRDAGIALTHRFPTADEQVDHVRSAILALVERMRLPSIVDIELDVRFARPPGPIIQIAERRAVDAIALGTSGHGFFERAILGSTVMPVVTDASCPVLVVPPMRDRAMRGRAPAP